MNVLGLHINTRKSFRKAVRKELELEKPASEVLVWYSENVKLLKTATAAYQNVDVDRIDECSIRDLETVLRPIKRALIASAHWLRENREQVQA